jgi:uncharacterized protein (TIGR03437 family)
VRFLTALLLFVAVLKAQTTFALANAASAFPVNQVAPGSLVKELSLNAPSPLFDPSTVSITLQPTAASNPIALPLVNVDGFSVEAMIPANVPVGPATAVFSYNGQKSQPWTVQIVPSSFGVFLQGGQAAGAIPGNLLAQPVHPGDYVTLWGTGLGTATMDQVAVLVGGHPAPVEYAGHAPGLPGTDQINFQVPDDPAIPDGCYVAIAVQAAGVSSNVGSLSKSSSDGPCVSLYGFTSDQVAQLDAGQSLYFGQISLYSLVGAPPPQPNVTSSGFTRMEGADAFFRSVNAASLAQTAEPLEAPDAYFACRAGGIGASAFIYRFMDAGPQITLSSNGTTLNLLPPTYGAQLSNPTPVTSPDAVPASFFTPGIWQVTGPGGADIPAFTGQLSVPAVIHVPNANALSVIDRSQDLMLAWNGGDYSDTDAVTMYLSGTAICHAPASAGSFTVPVALLAGFPSSNAYIELQVTRRPDQLSTFAIPTTSAGPIPVVFSYSFAETLPVGFK